MQRSSKIVTTFIIKKLNVHNTKKRKESRTSPNEPRMPFYTADPTMI